jgi:hypothetical protein
VHSWSEPWVCPCANKWFRCRDQNLCKGMSRWFPSKISKGWIEIQKWIVISRPPVVWTSELIKKVKRVDNVVSRVVDHWFDSTIGGYITEFAVDRT